MNLGNLVVQLAVKADTFTVRDFSKAIGDIPFSVASAITSMAGLSIGFVEMTKDVLNMSTGLRVFTAETGLNTTALQQWQQVAKEVGLSADVATSSIGRISQLLAGLRTGYGDWGALTALSRLGVTDLSGNAYDVANRIQEAVKGRSPADAAKMLEAAGLGGMMPLFGVSQKEREGIRPTITNRDQAQLAEFTKELAIFSNTTLREFTKVLVEFEPYMKDLTQALTFVIAHLGGWVGKGIGEDARLFNEITKKGLGGVLGDIVSSYATPQNLRDPKFNQAFFNAEVHAHGVQDPQAMADAVYREFNKRHMIALKAFNNQGAP